MDFEKLIPIDWSNQRVLTTAQLADFYETSTDNIKKNFSKNRNRFIECKHYFKLEGNDLATFKDWVTDSYLVQTETSDWVTDGYLVQKNTRALYLWTVRGAARHAKMLSTDKAWDVFELLEENYFNPKTAVIAPVVARPVPNPNRRAGQLKPACVYAALMSNGIVKIGQSNNVEGRKASLKRKFKLTVEKVHKTSLMPRKIARAIEKACHDIFSSSNVGGEFFSVDFGIACKVIDSCEKLLAPFVNDEKLIAAPLA